MLSNYFKVGAGILIAIAIVVAAYRAVQENKLGGDKIYTIKVVFDNVEGLSEGNDVWLSGIKIGSIRKLTLLPSGKVQLDLQIEKKYKVLKGSTFAIRLGILEEKVLSIEKPVKMQKPYTYYEDGTVIKNAQPPVTMQKLVKQADQAMTEVNRILFNARQVVENEQMKQDILLAMNNIAETTAEARDFVKMLNDTGMANRGHIDETLANIEKISNNLLVTSDKLDQLLDNANDIAGDETLKQQIKDIAGDLKETMKNLNDTTKSIKDLATDDQVKQDIKETIKSTKNTMDNADVALRGFSKMIKAVNETEIKPDFEFRYETRPDEYYADMNLRIFPPNSKVYYLLGLDNLGESSASNLQFAFKGNLPDEWLRVGIKSGKLGVGAEMTKKNLYYEGELLDPNDLQLNLRVGRGLAENTYLMFGWEGVLKRDSLSFGLLQRY